jgi:hypothetical protein
MGRAMDRPLWIYFFIVPPGEAASPFFSAEPAVFAPWVLASFDEGLEFWAAGPVVSFFMADPPPVVLPFMDSPVVVLLAAGPPACELPPALPAPLWARAIDDESANAVASINVLVFMSFLVLKPVCPGDQFAICATVPLRGDSALCAKVD